MLYYRCWKAHPGEEGKVTLELKIFNCKLQNNNKLFQKKSRKK